MYDVEFLTAGDDADGEDDVLTVGPSRRPPAWIRRIAYLLVGIVVVGVLAAKAHRSPGRDGQQAAPAPVPSQIAVGPRVADTGPLGPSALAVTIAAGRLYSLTPDALTWFGMGRGRRTSDVPIHPTLAYTDTYFRLIYDDVVDSLWVVPLGGSKPGRLLEFDTAGVDLRLLRTIRLPTTLASAAVLDGGIYLGTGDRGLLALRPGARTLTTVATSREGVGQVVADPSRNRLLYLTDALPTRVRSWSIGHVQSKAVGTLAFTKAELVVVGGRIWAGGFSGHGAALVGLDPGTLQPVQSAERTAGVLGPGAIIVAGGTHDFFVRSGASSEPLWCVDGRTGDVRQHWDRLVGAVAVEPAAVWIAGGAGVQRFPLHGCDG